MKKFLFFIIVIALVVAAAILAYKREPNNSSPAQSQPTDSSANTSAIVSALNSKCGMIVSSPNAGDTVSFPLNVKTIVDNSASASLGCAWTVFEAQAGTASLVDPATKTVYATIPLTTTEDWTKIGPVDYSAKFSSMYANLPTNFNLVITEEDPSGNGNPDTISLPLSQ